MQTLTAALHNEFGGKVRLSVRPDDLKLHLVILKRMYDMDWMFEDVFEETEQAFNLTKQKIRDAIQNVHDTYGPKEEEEERSVGRICPCCKGMGILQAGEHNDQP